jgi:plasmid maintenance system antidote protein VapI
VPAAHRSRREPSHHSIAPGDLDHLVTGILNGTRSITGDTALRLAHFFGTSPQFWLNLQALYEIRLAERKSRRAIEKLPTLKQAVAY